MDYPLKLKKNDKCYKTMLLSYTESRDPIDVSDIIGYYSF